MAKACRWTYHNKNTSVELGVFCWFLIHSTQINARTVERIAVMNLRFQYKVEDLLTNWATIDNQDSASLNYME
jgi:hypothetical protein